MLFDGFSTVFSKCNTQHDWLDYFLLYSWNFSCYTKSIHWLVHGHMSSNNETGSRQMPWAGQHCENYDIKREIVHYYPGNVDRCPTWSEVAWCCHWNLSAFFKICFRFVLLYNKSLNDWSLGEQWILFPSTSSRETLRLSGNKFHCSNH